MNRHELSEVRNRRFCRRICRNFCQRSESVHRGYHNNAAILFFRHITGKNLRRNKRSKKVEIKNERYSLGVKIKEGFHILVLFNKVDFFKRFLCRRALGVVSACTVEENIACAELFGNNVPCLFHALRFKHVTADGNSRTSV